MIDQLPIVAEFARVAVSVMFGCLAISFGFITWRQWTGSRDYRAEMSSNFRGVHCNLKTGDLKAAPPKRAPK